MRSAQTFFILLCVVAVGILSVLFGGSTVAAACPLQANTPYKIASRSSVYYVTDSCTKVPIKNPAIYFSYFDSWQNVQAAQPSALDLLPLSDIGFLPWGPKKTFENGSVIKTPYDSRVYLLLSGQLYQIKDEDAFRGLGFQWNWVEDVAEEVLQTQAVQDSVISQDNIPQRLVFKYDDDPAVYELRSLNDEERKQYIETMQELNEKYRADRIVVWSREREYEDYSDVREEVKQQEDNSESNEQTESGTHNSDQSQSGSSGGGGSSGSSSGGSRSSSSSPSSSSSNASTTTSTTSHTTNTTTTPDVVVSSTPATDTTAPIISSFSVTASANKSATLSLTATDNAGVTGWYVSEQNTTPALDDTQWLSTAPTSFSFATYGPKTVFAWAKDGAGNVSTVSQATVTLSSTNALYPKDLLIYYGYPSSINDAHANIATAAQTFGEYEFVVLGEGLEFASHDDHANTVAIMAHSSTANTLFFGYVDSRRTTALDNPTGLYARIDAWADSGADGIFFDVFGYDYEITREKQNAIVDYARAKGMNIFVNAWDPDDAFSSSVDAVYNPGGVATHLTSGDYYLSESYQITNGAYVSAAEWRAKEQKLATYRDSLGIHLMAEPLGSGSFNQAQFYYAWFSGLMDEYEAIGWSTDFTNRSQVYMPRPSIDVGTSYAGNTIQSGSTYTRSTDAGMISVDTISHSFGFTQ